LRFEVWGTWKSLTKSFLVGAVPKVIGTAPAGDTETNIVNAEIRLSFPSF
jgi:hypothetical protein